MRPIPYLFFGVIVGFVAFANLGTCKAEPPKKKDDQSSEETSASKRSLSEKIAILSMLSQQTKNNYKRIQTWTGCYRYQDRRRIDAEAAKAFFKDFTADVAEKNFPLTSTSSSTIRFDVDVTTDSLFSGRVVDGPPEIKTKTGNLLKLTKFVGYNGMSMSIVGYNEMSIFTSEHYLHFMPTMDHALSPSFPKVSAGRMAFRESNRRNADRFGSISDPRSLFSIQPPLLIHDWLNGFCTWSPTASPEENKELDNVLDVNQVKIGDDTVYIIGFRRSAEKEIRFSEKNGFNLISSCEREPNGEKMWQKTWEYQKVDDVYIPSKIQTKNIGNDGNIEFESTMSLVECSLNKSIDPMVFTYAQFGLKNGERIIDKIENTLFVYQDGKLIPAKDYSPPK